MARTCTVDGCDRPHRARGLCQLHWKQWRHTVTKIPDTQPPDGALTATDIARLADVAPRTVTNWPALGRIPPPDGHASGQPWWWPASLPPLARRKRRSAPSETPLSDVGSSAE